MKYTKLAVLLMAAALIGSKAALAKTITVTVNGMVCAFCAQGITKKFKAEAAVKEVHVDLDNKVVKLETKEGQDLDDKVITQGITDSGFNIVSITRE